jgi:RNA polymerase sigma factor (TIGR02999 family)
MAMRRILVNHAKAQAREKRGGGAVTLSLDAGLEVGAAGQEVDVVALDQVLSRLAELSERACQVVECRYFAGLSIEETAEALGVAPMTVKRDWLLAKTWLRRELHGA